MFNFRLIVILVAAFGIASLAVPTCAAEKRAKPAATDDESTSSGDEQDQDTPAPLGKTGLPLPRFASLKTGPVNLRTGPGTRYPIEWVLLHKSMPLEITAEYEAWRRVRDNEGAEGWVHRGALSGKRTALVTGVSRNLRSQAEDNAATVARVEPGAVGRILSCAAVWCNLKFGNTDGFLRKEEFWGVYGGEVIEE